MPAGGIIVLSRFYMRTRAGKSRGRPGVITRTYTRYFMHFAQPGWIAAHDAHTRARSMRPRFGHNIYYVNLTTTFARKPLIFHAFTALPSPSDTDAYLF